MKKAEVKIPFFDAKVEDSKLASSIDRHSADALDAVAEQCKSYIPKIKKSAIEFNKQVRDTRFDVKREKIKLKAETDAENGCKMFKELELEFQNSKN